MIRIFQFVFALMLVVGGAMLVASSLSGPRTRLACPEPASQVILASPHGPVCVNGTPAIRVPR